MTQEKHFLFLCFDLFCRFFWIFFFFLPLHSSCLLLFPHSVTLFMVVINLCLYIGLLQFCGVFLFFLSLFFILIFNILNLLLFFHIYSFACFSYCPFPLAVKDMYTLKEKGWKRYSMQMGSKRKLE